MPVNGVRGGVRRRLGRLLTRRARTVDPAEPGRSRPGSTRRRATLRLPEKICLHSSSPQAASRFAVYDRLHKRCYDQSRQHYAL